MALNGVSKKRIILPRWRDFAQTKLNQELNYNNENNVNPPKINIDNVSLQNWNISKNLHNAIALLNASIISGDTSIAKDAITLIIDNKENVSCAVFELAQMIRNNRFDFNETIALVDFNDTRKIHDLLGSEIRKHRLSTKQIIHNPFRWLQLSRLYTILGNISAADRSMKVAVHLAPSDRYILRSYIAFNIIKDNFEQKDSNRNWARKVHKFLLKNANLKDDPLLISAEIGLSEHIKSHSRSIDQGVTLLDSNQYSPRAICELASAIGTKELENGKRLNAFKYFKQSLLDSNENSIAQAEWASSQINLELNFKHECAYEANAKLALKEGNLEIAITQTKSWFLDQPYSGESAIMGSYVAGCLLDDNDEAINFCNLGLVSSPFDFTLLNNKAYYLAIKGKIKEAEDTFNLIELENLVDDELVIATATFGLILHKKGETEKGNQFYNIACKIALSNNKFELAMKVKLFKLRTNTLNFNQFYDFNSEIESLRSEMVKYSNNELNTIFQNILNRIEESKRKIIKI